MSAPDGTAVRLATAAAALGGAGLAGALAAGLFHPRVALFGPAIWRGPSHRPTVALTFDDGPHPRYSLRIAELLERHRARATFFCVGREVVRHRDVARALFHAGHQLANHTFRHNTGLDLFLGSRLAADLNRCQEVLFGVTGTRTRYYRPAVGIRNPAVHRAARLLEMTVVTWTDTARDGLFRFSEARAGELARRARPGSILVLHDGAAGEESSLREETVRHLPFLLNRLAERGLVPVTLSELLAG
jgi:peptidoglycan/xylan/chitin deacetylase (PgdA/CDA1 family)